MKYLATRVETVTVEADSAAEAQSVADELFMAELAETATLTVEEQKS